VQPPTPPIPPEEPLSEELARLLHLPGRNHPVDPAAAFEEEINSGQIAGLPLPISNSLLAVLTRYHAQRASILEGCSSYSTDLPTALLIEMSKTLGLLAEGAANQQLMQMRFGMLKMAAIALRGLEALEEREQQRAAEEVTRRRNLIRAGHWTPRKGERI
jgi:hypothetical protein